MRRVRDALTGMASAASTPRSPVMPSGYSREGRRVYHVCEDGCTSVHIQMFEPCCVVS
jgi:hypothetical protein